MSDDPGVLGNLPRSRPGRRSDKRAATSVDAAPRKPASTGARAKPPATQAKRATGKSGTVKARAPQPARSAQRKTPVAEEQQGANDPVSGAIRAAGQVAEAGVKTAAKVAGGVLKRLPRL